MKDTRVSVQKTLLYTVSGGFISLAFGVLGATAAHAGPRVPVEAGGGGKAVTAPPPPKAPPGGTPQQQQKELTQLKAKANKPAPKAAPEKAAKQSPRPDGKAGPQNKNNDKKPDPKEEERARSKADKRDARQLGPDYSEYGKKEAEKKAKERAKPFMGPVADERKRRKSDQYDFSLLPKRASGSDTSGIDKDPLAKLYGLGQPGETQTAPDQRRPTPLMEVRQAVSDPVGEARRTSVNPPPDPGPKPKAKTKRQLRQEELRRVHAEKMAYLAGQERKEVGRKANIKAEKLRNAANAKSKQEKQQKETEEYNNKHGKPKGSTSVCLGGNAQAVTGAAADICLTGDSRGLGWSADQDIGVGAGASAGVGVSVKKSTANIDEIPGESYSASASGKAGVGGNVSGSVTRDGKHNTEGYGVGVGVGGGVMGGVEYSQSGRFFDWPWASDGPRETVMAPGPPVPGPAS